MTKTLLWVQQQQGWEDEAEQLQADIQLAVTSRVAARRNLLATMLGHLAQLEVLYRRGRSFGTYNALYRAQLTYEELRK